MFITRLQYYFFSTRTFETFLCEVRYQFPIQYVFNFKDVVDLHNKVYKFRVGQILNTDGILYEMAGKLL